MKRLLILCLLMTTSVLAANKPIKLIGGREYALSIPNQKMQIITLQKFHLDKKAAHDFLSRLQPKSVRRWLRASQSAIPTHRALGMNGVPVLNQGAHGACVVFAVNAALDAINDGKDSLSELCTLELGSYLHQKNSAYPSGWDGSFAANVLNQYRQYGAIDRLDQTKNRCGGLDHYPLYEPSETGMPMSIADYTARSHPVNAGLNSYPIMSVYDAVETQFDAEKKLRQLKEAIAQGHRVVVGFVLDPMLGEVGALGKHKRNDDTWTMNETIEKAMHNNCNETQCHLDGHEVVITAYDDATRIGNNKGLLTIRNSWGASAGDHGNYYMTYDYFKALAMEATVIQ